MSDAPTIREADSPAWATPEYIEQCRSDAELQSAWRAKPGDWYYCGDRDGVFQVSSEYFEEANHDLSCFAEQYQMRARSAGHWPCDVYLPELEDVKAERHRQLVEAGHAINVETAAILDDIFGPISVERIKAIELEMVDPKGLLKRFADLPEQTRQRIQERAKVIHAGPIGVDETAALVIAMEEWMESCPICRGDGYVDKSTQTHPLYCDCPAGVAAAAKDHSPWKKFPPGR